MVYFTVCEWFSLIWNISKFKRIVKVFVLYKMLCVVIKGLTDVFYICIYFFLNEKAAYSIYCPSENLDQTDGNVLLSSQAFISE